MLENILWTALLLCAFFWLVGWGGRRAHEVKTRELADERKRGERLALEQANQWQDPPPIGRAFVHCDRKCVVVLHGWATANGWVTGVHAHYANDAGEIKDLYLTRAQWEALQRGVGR